MSLRSILFSRGFAVVNIGYGDRNEIILRRPIILRRLDRMPELSIQIYLGETYDGKQTDGMLKVGLYSHTLNFFGGIIKSINGRARENVVDRLMFQLEREILSTIRECYWAAQEYPADDEGIRMELRKSRVTLRRDNQGRQVEEIDVVRKGQYYFCAPGTYGQRISAARRSEQFKREEHIVMCSVRNPNTDVKVTPRPCYFDQGDLALYFNDSNEQDTEYGHPVIMVVHEIDYKAGVVFAYIDGDDPEAHREVGDPAGECKVIHRLGIEELFPIDQTVWESVYPSEDRQQLRAKEELDKLPPGTQVPYISKAGATPDYIAMLSAYEADLAAKNTSVPPAVPAQEPEPTTPTTQKKRPVKKSTAKKSPPKK